jgi:hypothetical protein
MTLEKKERKLRRFINFIICYCGTIFGLESKVILTQSIICVTKTKAFENPIYYNKYMCIDITA